MVARQEDNIRHVALGKLGQHLVRGVRCACADTAWDQRNQEDYFCGVQAPRSSARLRALACNGFQNPL